MFTVFMKRLETRMGQNPSNITRLRSVFTKRFGVGVALGLVIVALLLLLSYVFPQGAASGMAKAILWGFGGTVLLLSIGGLIFFVSRLRKKKPASEGKVAERTTATPSNGIAGAFLDALTCPLTWILWLLLFGAVWWYSHNLLTTPNSTWVPLGLWALFVLFLKAKAYSAEKSAGKEKKAHPGLVIATKTIYRLAFLSTLAVTAYYAHFAPAGTWERETGRTSERGAVRGPNKMPIPDGIPLNPNFASTKLANWNVVYIAANPQYQVPQAKWSGKKLALLEEPGREVTEIVNLTVGFGPGNESLDIRLSGSCRAILDNRRPQISKTCAGWWKDRGGKIAGQFYLQVNEESNRYFDIYLFDGNYLPKKGELAMMLSGPPIPAIMLQFRPKNWNEDK